MTPKEKADEIIRKITDSLINSGARIGKQSVIHCAIIFVDEIINSGLLVAHIVTTPAKNDELFYWQSVKTEIEKL